MVDISRRSLIEQGCKFSLFLTAASMGHAELANAQAPVVIKKVLKVGVANELPYSFLDTQGVLSGQSVEVLEAAFANSSVDRMDGVLTEFAALIPGLIARRFDVVCTGMFIRPARCAQIAFGHIDSMGRIGMIVPTDNPKKLTGFEDFRKNSDLRLAFIRGSIVDGYARAQKVPESQWVILPDFTTLLAAIKGGRADAAMGGYIILSSTLQKVNDPGLQMAPDFVQIEVNGRPAIDYAAMGFHKDDNVLRETYNKGLDELIQSGRLIEINKKWGIPSALTATADTPKPEEVCRG